MSEPTPLEVLDSQYPRGTGVGEMWLLEKRIELAGMAMQGLLSNSVLLKHYTNIPQLVEEKMRSIMLIRPCVNSAS